MGKAARLKAERRREATRPPAGPAVRHGSSPMEHVAAHEAGHAVVQWTLNLPFDYVSLDTSPAGVWPLDGVKKHMGDTWLIGAAGCIADLQLRELVLPDPEILKLVLGSPDSLFSVVDRSGTVVVRPSRNPAVAPGGDLHMMAVVMSDDGDGVPWPAAEIIGVWRDCERYVAACRGAIEAVAAELLRVRKLTYFATGHIAAKAAGSGPLPPVPGWFEDVQQVSRQIEAEEIQRSSPVRRSQAAQGLCHLDPRIQTRPATLQQPASTLPTLQAQQMSPLLALS